MTLIPINDDNAQRTIVISSIVILGIITVAGFFTVSGRFALSAVAGGVIVLANQFWLHSILARVIAGHAENAARYAVIRYVLRLSLIAVAVVALFRLNVDITGLFAGLSILVIATVIISIYSLVHNKGESS